MSLFGTLASFETQTNPLSELHPRRNASVWYHKPTDRTEDLTDLLTCDPAGYPDDPQDHVSKHLHAGMFSGLSGVHDVARLPVTFQGLPNGHEGSHQFLVLDFIDSLVGGKLPPNNVWFAARCCVPGIVAHASAKRGGELLKVPDFGDPPARA